MSESQINDNPAPVDRHGDAERNEARRRAAQLVKAHLGQTSRLPNLGAELAAQVSEGSVELYNRLKPRDPIDSMYCTTIVALQNAIISSFARATRREEHLGEAYKGVALFIETVAVRESRRALMEHIERRQEIVNELMHRYGLEPHNKGEG